MFDDALKQTWTRAERDAPPLSREAVEALLRPGADKASRAFALLARTQLAMHAATVLLAGANLYVYRGAPGMLAVEGGIAACAIAFAALTVRFLAGLRRVHRADLPLLEAVERRLAFLERTVRPGIAVACVTPWLLTMTINPLVDAGEYRIHHPFEFVLVSAAVFAIVYASLRVSLGPLEREMRAVLHDLRAQALEQTPTIAAAKRRSRIWMIALFVLLTASVAVGVVAWIRAS